MQQREDDETSQIKQDLVQFAILSSPVPLGPALGTEQGRSIVSSALLS